MPLPILQPRCTRFCTQANFFTLQISYARVNQHLRSFIDRYNSELVEIHRVSSEYMEAHRTHLREIIAEYNRETGSAWGAEVYDNFEDYVGKFWLVKPKAADLQQLLTRLRETD